MAAEKLVRAGFSRVGSLDGGLEAWRQAELPVVEGMPLPAPPALPDGRVEIDLAESRVEWLGRNLLNKHHGSAALKSGHLVFDGGRLAGGEFAVDLTRLTCTDLAGDPLHDVLIRHLQSDDFFDTERFPEARFVITGVEIRAGTPGSPNLRLHGELTIKDHVHAIAFDAAAGITAEGKPAAQAVFSLDRTLWGVLYGSGKHFRRLAGHLVNDLIEFQIRVVGR
jgi:polyisoprenoid-binding protein YceI